MRIEVQNPSSPGTSFTDNTNSVLLKSYLWICEHKGLEVTYDDFRRRLEVDNIGESGNNRNIFSLLKTCGMAQYEENTTMLVDNFYTNSGLAYITVLDTLKILRQDNSTIEENVSEAETQFLDIQKELIYGALIKICSNKQSNYNKPFKDMVDFLLKYNKINKAEYAYLIYNKASKDISNDVEAYRNGSLQMDFFVINRDGQQNDGLGNFTAYTYFTSLLRQAGLIDKIENNYYKIAIEKTGLLKKLVEV
ncbi:hypothetical protein IJ541_07520 [bacterium]|nr:hypothetical protein [bacterium]